MRLRPVAIALLVLQAVFLNIVVPGHTRGAVTLDGARSGGDGRGDSACGGHCHGTDESSDPKSAPTPQDRTKCAVCHLAARITPPPAFAFEVAPPERLELLPLPPPHAAESAEFVPTYYGRGPPFAV